MIIKIKSHKKPSFLKLLDYMVNDKDRLFDKEGHSFAITHNLKGDSIEEWVKQYKDNEQYRQYKRVNSVLLTHEIISFHKDDAKNISLDKLENIAREYILQRGINGMYLAVPHFDKEHYHIHVCASGIEYKTGKTMRLSKMNLQSLKKKVQEYQIEKYPELSKSLVNHEKKVYALSDKEYKYQERTGRATDKEQLVGMLKTCYKKAVSKDDFFQKLNESGLKTYIRGGRIYGVVFSGRKFRLKTMGFTEERLQELEKTLKQTKELSELREKTKEKIISRRR
ncbi:MAG: relaxase/mobilization nuclease domain-containing protein [Bacteroidota bacterium]